MAIFVALIFQVLFVLFAMAINIGLVVHDKINLQNATDLAAYYGAQKQAEWLNVMAHQNYQIRQAWKLFTFRYRVLGSMGMENPPHPARYNSLVSSDSEYEVADNSSICIVYPGPWNPAPKDENFCQEVDYSVQAPPSNYHSLTPWDPLSVILAQKTKQFSETFKEKCDGRGGWNWLFAARIKLAFRIDQKNRLETIEAGFNNLKQHDFLTLDGDSVFQGMDKTFKKNLTATNRASANLEYFNSMESGVSFNNFFNINHIAPQMVYTDLKGGSGCIATRKSSTLEPEAPSSKEFLRNNLDPADLETLRQWGRVSEPSGANVGFDHNSLGLEKNPWYSTYMAVKATAQPRQVFSPFGSVQIVAHSYAKPFGGRFGPWFFKNWSPGSPKSTGNPTDRVDPLTPNRVDNTQNPDSTNNDPDRHPNYSRFPGDQLGLKSKLALAPFIMNGPANMVFRNANMSLEHFNNTTLKFENGKPNDTLAFNTKSNQKPPVRRMEMAAVSPDLFDATYYSVLPRYSTNVLPKLHILKGKGMFENTVLRGDLGSRGTDVVSVVDQMELMNGQNGSQGMRNDHVYYFLNHFSHLLTGWVEQDYGDYKTFPDKYFADCKADDGNFQKASTKTINSCIIGGRTGYSVKLVSRSFLTSPISAGGAGVDAARILNPPPDEF